MVDSVGHGLRVFQVINSNKTDYFYSWENQFVAVQDYILFAIEQKMKNDDF